MASVGSPISGPPSGTFRDCSQGICSFYCPQWCYYIFPPPPPEEDDSGPNFSPLIIAVIGVLASAFLLVTYYTIISKYCKRRRRGDQGPAAFDLDAAGDQIHRDQWQPGAQAGLDEALIKSITVCRYKRGEGLIEGTECAVCLSEFQEEENLRLLPKCSHAFHLPCIDTWLKAHSNCPLCRAAVAPPPSSTASLPPPQNSIISQNPATLAVNSLQIQRGNDLVFVVDDRIRREEVVITLACENGPKNTESAGEGNSESGHDVGGTAQMGVQNFRRSVSLHSFEHISASGTLGSGQDGTGPPGGSGGLLGENSGAGFSDPGSCPGVVKRTVSTGRIASRA
ncbi:hypothetical protein NMG60_11029308 [Bertholletia excelsa]